MLAFSNVFDLLNIVFVWQTRQSKEHTPKPGKVGNLEECCTALEKNCYDMKKVVRCWREKNQWSEVQHYQTAGARKMEVNNMDNEI